MNRDPRDWPLPQVVTTDQPFHLVRALMKEVRRREMIIFRIRVLGRPVTPVRIRAEQDLFHLLGLARLGVRLALMSTRLAETRPGARVGLPVLDRLLTLTCRKNRYYDLDVLGSQPPAESSPSELWEELETAIGKSLYPDATQWYEMAVKYADQYDAEVYAVLIDHLKWGLSAITKIMITGRRGDPTLGWPQHFLDYLFEFALPARLYVPYHG